jgi:MobA/VirD2-like, nuclease domain
MIIKSMSRKAPTFAQLIGYIGRDAGPDTTPVFARNLYHSGQDGEAVARQFEANFRYLPQRKNGNALYHEVIVLEAQPHLPRARVEQALHDLAEAYCSTRAPHQLAWGRVHWDTEYPHIHLMISANTVRSDRRVRMEKSFFAKLQRDLERFKQAEFPELAGAPVYTRSEPSSRPRVKQNEGELIRRTGRPSGKVGVFNLLQPVFAKATNLSALKRRLADHGFELYQRGRNWGVCDQTSQRRYRLKTLGLETAFKQLKKRDSVPSQPERSEVAKPPDQQPDDRATALLHRRQELADRAQSQLDGFERDIEEGPDR